MAKKFVESSKEAARGGFQGIKKVRGMVVDIDLVPAPEGWDTDKDQIQVSLEDAVVLEMFEGEEDFELKESKFNFLYPYSVEGAKPSANGPYMKCLVASAEKLGKKPTDFIGQVTTFDKLPVVLFRQRDKEQEKGEDGKYPLVDIITDMYFSIVADEGADSENVKAYAREKLSGLTQKATLRKLMTDSRLKQYPEFKDMHSNGQLADYLDMTIVDGKYMAGETNES